MPSLTQIYNTEGMWGSWELLKKFSVIGSIVQFFLTVYGLLANVSCLLRVTTTIFFLSNRRKFDEIDRVQSEGLSSSFRAAQGFNKIIVAFYCILPNIKQLSDYGSSQFNLDDEDNVITYIAKTTPSTLAIIVFSSMAFNGLLFQIYANISEGILAVARQARDLQIAKAVEECFNSGKDYKFTLNHIGSSQGTAKYKVAKSVYVDVCNRYHLSDATTKTVIGSSIEGKLNGDKSAFDTAISDACKAYPEVGKWQASNKGSSIYDVLNFSVAPASYEMVKGASGPKRIGNSGAVYIPVSYFDSRLKNDGDFAGYIVTVSYKIPTASKFQLNSGSKKNP